MCKGTLKTDSKHDTKLNNWRLQENIKWNFNPLGIPHYITFGRQQLNINNGTSKETTGKERKQQLESKF